MAEETLISDRPPRARGIQIVLILLLCVVGIEAWLTLGNGLWGSWGHLFAIAIGVLLAIPRKPAEAGAALIKSFVTPHRSIVAVIIALVAALYLYFTAVSLGREFFPKWHDEFIYLIQTEQIARGTLWRAGLAWPGFFDTFYLFVEPVYASLSFPGTAILYAPRVWLNSPAWVASLACAGACVGLLYRIVAEIFDDSLGLTAALLLLGVATFRRLSIMTISQLPMLLMSLAMLGSLLLWTRRRSPATAAIFGAITGWALITRPLDALAFAVPSLLYAAWLMSREGVRKNLRSIAAGAAAAAPFLLVQLVFNLGVTGSPLTTPNGAYYARDIPGLGLGFGFGEPNPLVRPASPLPQKQRMYDEWVLPMLREHRPENILPDLLSTRLPIWTHAGLAHPLLIMLLPLSVLAIRRQTWIWPASIILLIGAYSLYPSVLRHYAVPLAGAMAVTVVMAMEGFGRLGPRARRIAVAAGAAVAVASLPQFQRLPDDYNGVAPTVVAAEHALRAIVGKPAIVFFTWNPARDLHDEPVYTYSAAHPDDAQIIRARDLGEQNIELIQHYAQLQPDRDVYRFDERDGKLYHLGSVTALAKR